MPKPVIAVVSFPGNNCEFESLRAIAQSDMEPLFFRWNDDRAKLKDVDGYFLVGGFSYEDRGRSGMVAGRDPLMDFIGREAEAGKVVIGNCNGAQILVESGLIPMDHELRMCLARNVVSDGDTFHSPGFLSEWVWITPACAEDRCATSSWKKPMHLPIAHGEGRFTTKDKDVIDALKKNGQLAFSYCTEDGKISEEVSVTPNGSLYAAAGICNPAGNVIALMPHPERTPNGKPYFDSIRVWIETNKRTKNAQRQSGASSNSVSLPKRTPRATEIFIDTIITNNEERTVEKTAKTFAPTLSLKQFKYFLTSSAEPKEIFTDLSLFNPNKERAIVRRGTNLFAWNSAAKKEEPLSPERKKQCFGGVTILRRDIPDTAPGILGGGGESGICYSVSGVSVEELQSRRLAEVFCNPHASELSILS